MPTFKVARAFVLTNDDNTTREFPAGVFILADNDPVIGHYYFKANAVAQDLSAGFTGPTAAAPQFTAEPPAADPEAVAPPVDEPDFDPQKVTEADIAVMNRNELFAFLKSRGIVRQPPIKNDDLRAAARAAFA